MVQKRFSFCLLLIICFCNKPVYDIQFCFSTIVGGSVFVSDTKVGVSSIPCGFLSAVNAPRSNAEFDFDHLKGICAAIASGYKMEIPDTAFISWENELDKKTYQKRIALQSFPSIKPNEKYQIGFCIGYQDCVYVRIETIQK